VAPQLSNKSCKEKHRLKDTYHEAVAKSLLSGLNSQNDTGRVSMI